MRIIHTADLHLGQILYQWYHRVDEHDAFFRQLGDWCAGYQPDSLVVSGDVFDIPQPSAAVKQYFNQVVAALHRRCPSMAIVIVAGNHDSASRLQADSVVWDLASVKLVGRGPGVDALQQADGWQDEFIVELPVGFIVALPFMLGVRTDAVQAVLDRVAARNVDGRPVVMMGHLAVQDSDFTGHDDIGNQRVFEIGDLGSGYDYAALGHIHRPQTLGASIDDEYQEVSTYPAGVVRYSGSALHVSCDETYPHTVSLVDIDRHGGTVTLTRLPIEELRHFRVLPQAGLPPYASADEALAGVDAFCGTEGSDYFRLRLSYAAPVPPDFQQQIYARLAAFGNEKRFNPKHLWEGAPVETEEESQPDLSVADLQQMQSPLEFIRTIIDKYSDLRMEELEDDFREIEKEVNHEDH